MRRLTDEQRAIRDTTRDFVRKEIAPHAAEWDRSATMPLETVRYDGTNEVQKILISRELMAGH